MRSIIGTICCFLIFNCAEVHPQRRIFGGFKAFAGQFSYVVYVGSGCGGSILNEITILTAAHCVCRGPSAKEVRVGSNRISGGDIYQVDKIVCHDKYKFPELVNDIALMKLKNPLKYSKNIKAVELPMSNIADDESLIFAGWGETNTSQFIPDDLQYLYLKIVNYTKCEESARLLYNQQPAKGTLCAKSLGRGYGVCVGDSGGPLMTLNGTQYGIASSYTGGCAYGEPDVFTNAFSYKNWIEEKMKNL